MGLGLGLGGSGGHRRWPSAPPDGGTGPQPLGPEGALSAGRAGRPSGALGLCGGSLEEGTEEQIAKAEWWCLEGASPVHPGKGPDAAHHPLLRPGLFRSPSPGGEKLVGEGWLGFGKSARTLGSRGEWGLEGVGASWGLDAWVLSRKLGSWSAPPRAPPIPVNFLQFSFPTQRVARPL